jgi:hypothetical protein
MEFLLRGRRSARFLNAALVRKRERSGEGAIKSINGERETRAARGSGSRGSPPLAYQESWIVGSPVFLIAIQPKLGQKFKDGLKNGDWLRVFEVPVPILWAALGKRGSEFGKRCGP